MTRRYEVVVSIGDTNLEVHDPATLVFARELISECTSPEGMQQAVLDAVARNAEWRGRQCIHLLAPAAPPAPPVRAVLSAEVGTRAAEAHTGPQVRGLADTGHIAEIEARCVELLKKAF